MQSTLITMPGVTCALDDTRDAETRSDLRVIMHHHPVPPPASAVGSPETSVSLTCSQVLASVGGARQLAPAGRLRADVAVCSLGGGPGVQ